MVFSLAGGLRVAYSVGYDRYNGAYWGDGYGRRYRLSGVGDLALTYGYERLNFPLMLFTVIVLIIFVQIIQSFGNYFRLNYVIIKQSGEKIKEGDFMMNLKKLTVFLLAATLGTALLAETAAATAVIKPPARRRIGFSKSQGPYFSCSSWGVKPILEGYKITAKDMSDLLQADVALNEGEVDFNVEQHTAYMNNFNEKQGGHLAALTPIPTVPAGIYPGSKTALNQISDGANCRAE